VRGLGSHGGSARLLRQSLSLHRLLQFALRRSLSRLCLFTLLLLSRCRRRRLLALAVKSREEFETERLINARARVGNCRS